MAAAGMIESNRQWVVDWSGLYVGPVGDRRPPLVHIQSLSAALMRGQKDDNICL